MIISRTPLRISFVGGGSDLSSYYLHKSGAVISTAINKYIYINVNKKFDNKIRASYSITEIVDNAHKLKHQLIKESLKEVNILQGIEVTSISDIPSSGTGLGSSSSYTVGVLNALKAHKGEIASPKYLAETACDIEINRCNEPIGKQDQYVAAYGGFNLIKFNSDGSVDIKPIICKSETKVQLQNNLLMLYTGIERRASKILKKQNEETKLNNKNLEIMDEMVSLTELMTKNLASGDIDSIGKLLHRNWILKRQLSRGISTERINYWYETALKNGALGGKILGAGGGGFLLLYAPTNKHKKILNSLPELRNVKINFESSGSKIIYIEESLA